MKTVQEKTARLFRTLLVLLLLFTTLVGRAQPDYRAETNPGKGYWKIQTDYATRNTVIRFFNARHEAVYQETLRGKYVKLTKRNVRLFDEMLNRVVNSELLASQVKAYDLVATTDGRYTGTATSTSYVPEEVPAVFTPIENREFLANPFVNELGRLRINFANPDQKKVLIEITDDVSQTVYYTEWTHVAGYSRYFDTRHLISGKYRLLLKSPDKTLAYWLTINKPYHEYELKAAK
ncbi:hypothetical protein GCM10028803_19640 [Larkinella knui]|uniref:DUF3244 domain-containing protein n=1 Tax=Larkinella knui TaxID=2025310 RepID=A0A3P1CUY1_9BACT|nr:hypothetical protein [Larkinella knui]RRB17059.1 hypothetical protein EHT87_01885 [Larkinella knui]